MVSRINAELRLEIGKGKFFSVVGNPEIDDSLTSHGAEASLNILVERNGVIPKQGEIAFLTRNIGGVREKIFGGICGELPVKIGIAGDDIPLKLNSYIKYANYHSINNYEKTNTLSGHIIEAASKSGAYALPGATKQLTDLFIRPDPANDEPFFFKYPQGKLQGFLEQICDKRNCFWKIEDTGALAIDTLGQFNSVLKVGSNVFLNNPAPKTLLRIPEPGEAISRDKVFWVPGLSYKPIDPIASVVRYFGHNGKVYFTEYLGKNKEINPVIEIYRAEEDRNWYPLPKTADEILIIKITKPDMTTYNLKRKPFNPNQVQPPDGSFEARIRLEENKFFCSPADVPGGSKVEVFAAVNFIYYEEEDPAAINSIKANDEGAGDGRVFDDIDDENCRDLPTAIAAVKARRAQVCVPNLSISFGTNIVKGWKSAQQFVAEHESRSINYLVTIQNSKRKLLAGGRDFYSINAATIKALTPQDRQDMLIEKAFNPSKPPFATYTIDT